MLSLFVGWEYRTLSLPVSDPQGSPKYYWSPLTTVGSHLLPPGVKCIICNYLLQLQQQFSWWRTFESLIYIYESFHMNQRFTKVFHTYLRICTSSLRMLKVKMFYKMPGFVSQEIPCCYFNHQQFHQINLISLFVHICKSPLVAGQSLLSSSKKWFPM